MKAKPILPVKYSFPYDRIGGWSQRKGGFTIAFVYPRKKQPYVIKGSMRQIEINLKMEKRPAIVYKTIFYHKQTRTIEEVINLPERTHAVIWHKKERNKHSYYEINGYKNGIKVIHYILRRQPRCWLKQLDILFN